MSDQEIKQKLLKNGVKNLHEFGYPSATIENIMTDDVYKVMFKSMLKDNVGVILQVDKVIEELIKEIK